METTTRRNIYRSDDRIIAGVIGGFAEHFNLEPTIVRLSVVFVTVLTGIVPGVVTYLVAMMIMPAHRTPTHNETPSSVDYSARA